MAGIPPLAIGRARKAASAQLPAVLAAQVSAGYLTVNEARAAIGLKPVDRQKYGNVRCELDGYTFDSKAEMRHYCELVLRQKAGEIEALAVHPKYPLMVNDKTIAHYIADFTYIDSATGTIHTVDVKGGPTNTPLSKLKQRIFRAQYGREVEIVT